MTTDTIPLLAEMIDSYLTIHHDLLMTDSVTKTEDLQQQLSSIEKDMRATGCEIIYSTEKWEKYLLNFPDLKQYDLIVPELLKQAKEMRDSSKAALILDLLKQMENSVVEKNGRKECEQKFYRETDIIEILDGNTLIKNVGFSEPNLNPLIKNLKK